MNRDHQTGKKSAKEAAPGAALLVPYVGRRFGVVLDVGTVATALGAAGSAVGSLVSSYILGRRR